MKFNVEVDLEGGYDDPSLERQLIGAVAEKLIHGPWKGSADLDAVRKKAEAEVSKRIRECVDVRIEQICEEVLSEGIRATDDYGRPKGEPKSFHDVCKDKIAEKLGNRSYGLSSTLSSIVGKALAGDLKKAAQAQIKKLEADMDADFYAQMAAAFKKKAGIK